MVDLSYWKVLTRRKILTSEPETDNNFHRVLKTFDLTALGVGATLGVGVYVLTGHVARDQAGPSVILSFAIAAIASLFAGLCYAEFGARVPKAGSAYIYSYVCIGEFAAFIIGWNLILEYIIGSASVSRGISLYLDTLINDTLKVTFMEVTPINWGFMAPYFDFFAFTLAIVIGVSLAFGVQTSTMITNIFTVVNIGVVLFVIIAGSFKADLHNWRIDPLEVKEPYVVGQGGFFPFGFEGTLKGAATCFFGFVGFDCIATTGEEVKDPRRAIPRSILLSLLIIFLSYFGVSMVLTLMWPYYMQDVDAPLPFVFQEIKWPVAKWIVTIGGMIGLFASLFGAMFPLPRIIYAMAQDGLIFRHLGHISPKYKTPLAGNIWAAFMTGLMAALFDLTQLVNMLSIGTLLAYTVVAVSITIMRFMDNVCSQQELETDFTEDSVLNGTGDRTTCRSVFLQLFNTRRLRQPTCTSTRVVGTLLFFYCFCCFGFSLTLMYGRNEVGHLEFWAIGLLGIFLIFLLLFLLMISMQPREEVRTVFRVPLVPLIPGISIFVNIYLMLQLDIYTWIRFGVWMAIGIPIYLASTCMYNNTTEVRNLNIIKNHRKFSLNGKITLHLDDDHYKANGIIPKEDLATFVSIEDEYKAQKITAESISSPKQSLDDIVPAAQVADSHKEVKNSNGKIFFIEDTSSKESFDSKEEEGDAKSVLAMLDNVLQVEDSFGYNNFNRKTSIDSEMIPSFVETSTVAMVHNSYDSLQEEEGENIAETTFDEKLAENITKNEEEHNEQNQDLGEVIKDEISLLDSKLGKNEEVENKNQLTVATSEKVLNTKKENDNCEKNQTSSFEIIKNTESDKNHEVVNQMESESVIPVSRSSSDISNVSHEEDAIHSKSFKEKLSQLLAHVHPMTVKPKQLEIISPKPTEVQPTTSPKLKPSKSEPDLSHLFAEQPTETLLKTNSEQKMEDTASSSGGIPKPPKFDPILYKTVGTRKHYQTKDRPKLEVFLQNNTSQQNISKPPVIETTESSPSKESSPIPFKKRLENLLKMGPSHKITKTLPKFTSNTSSQVPVLMDIQVHSNQTKSLDSKNIIAINSTISSNQYKDRFSAVLKSINDRESAKQYDNQKIATQRPTTIEEARRNLRHVHAN